MYNWDDPINEALNKVEVDKFKSEISIKSDIEY